jgi:hypothetical protein
VNRPEVDDNPAALRGSNAPDACVSFAGLKPAETAQNDAKAR